MQPYSRSQPLNNTTTNHVHTYLQASEGDSLHVKYLLSQTPTKSTLNHLQLHEPPWARAQKRPPRKGSRPQKLRRATRERTTTKMKRYVTTRRIGTSQRAMPATRLYKKRKTSIKRLMALWSTSAIGSDDMVDETLGECEENQVVSRVIADIKASIMRHAPRHPAAQAADCHQGQTQAPPEQEKSPAAGEPLQAAKCQYETQHIQGGPRRRRIQNVRPQKAT
jgi:hypothetical protein